VADVVLWAARGALVAVGLTLWFWTQRRIGARPSPPTGIGDAVHDWTASLNRWLGAHPRAADALLVASSAMIDLLGVFLIVSTIFGPSVRPFVGLFILYSLRQACQGICAYAPPAGMIWRRPRVPSLLVTYDTATDLFFSGHTAIAVFGAIELARLGGGGWWIALGVTIAVFEAVTVLVLRAHYTADVFAAIITALWTVAAADFLGPACDRALATIVQGLAGG